MNQRRQIETQRQQIDILQTRVNNLRQPIINWLQFYHITDLENKSDIELITLLINKITNYREYGYMQNKNFELLLQIPITERNEERNITNWNIIVDTYHIHMKGTIERLGKPFENRGYRQQWQALFDQATEIIVRVLQIRTMITRTIQPSVDDPTRIGIMEMLTEIEMHLESTEEIIHNQEDEIRKAKEIILPTINQISPITAINGVNEQSIVEINQVAQELLLEQSKIIKQLQETINTQQIQITNLQNQPNDNCQQQAIQWKYTAYYIAQLQFNTCRECEEWQIW